MQTDPSQDSNTDRAKQLQWAFGSFPRFCGLLKIQPKKGGGRIPMVLSAIQREYCASRTTRDIILKPRQVYMTTLEAARDLWWFLTKPGARVVLVCQSLSDQGPLRDISYKFRVFIDSLRRLGVQLEFSTETGTEWAIRSKDATLRLIQAGASEASASKKGRGGTINRLHISEAAFFEHAEDTFNSLLESVPREGSEVVNESTPNGAVGFYHQQWKAAVEGRTAYTAHFFPWWTHEEYRVPLEPGQIVEATTELEEALIAKNVPAEALLWYRWKIREKGGNADLVSQEFPSDPETCFLEAKKQYIPTWMIQEALDNSPPLIVGKSYAGLDIGRENDLTVLTVVKVDRFGGVWVQEVRTCKRTEWQDQMAMILASYEDWDWTRLAIDATGMGSMPAELLQKAIGRHRVEPIVFSEPVKESLATGMYQRFADKTVHFRDHEGLVSDLCSLRRVVTAAGKIHYDTPRTKDGHGDRAWSLALALHACSPLNLAGSRTDLSGGDFRA